MLLVCAAALACGTAWAQNPFAGLPPDARDQASALLNELRSAGVQQATPAIRPALSDEELIERLALRDPASAMEALAAMRRQLDGIAGEREATAMKLGVWSAFADTVRDDKVLSAAWLPALRQIAALEAEDAALAARANALERAAQRTRVDLSLTHISHRFGALDWTVVVFYLVFTTVLGGLLAGRQASIRDFFLGGRTLPWPAVCGSIIATELSAATFLIAPAIVFSAGGDLTYLLLAIGTILARFIIGYFFVPAFYEREIFSPYDYMGHQLGAQVKHLTTGLFMLGAVLAQGARVYIAALALQVITGATLWWSISLIGGVSILWTFMGGIRTVIWTDVIQFILFLAGAIAALIAVHFAVDGGFAAVMTESYHAGKLNVLNMNLNTKEAFTIWCGLFASPFATLASHGTDQMMAQRMFTCRDQVAARKAIIWSSLSLVPTILLLLVGAGLFVYYRHHSLTPVEQVVVDDNSMKIFAIFIVDVLPAGVSGLLMAGIFAAAISTLDSVLAALSQSTISSIYKPLIRPTGDDRHYVRVSRLLVIFWGVVMTLFAMYCHTLASRYPDLIQFALAMAAYTHGALLGAFLLAFLPLRRDGRGLLWGAPLAVLTVFSLNWHTGAAQLIVAGAGLVMMVQAFRHLSREPGKVLVIAVAAALTLLVSGARLGTDDAGAPIHISLAWPWHFPIGVGVTLLVGYLVGREKDNKDHTDDA